MPLRSGLFPDLTLPDPEGAPHPLREAWAKGRGLILIGHRDCKTTRETLPVVDRIHRRRGKDAQVIAVLQDDAATARELQASLKLELPLRLEDDPYPLAARLELTTVPTLFALDAAGAIQAVSEGFRRSDLEDLAARLGVHGPLFGADEKVPALKPG